MVTDPVKATIPEEIFAGGGEMGALMRSLDWSQTLLGPASQWAQSLKTSVSMILNSRHPMFVWWGAESAYLYNDAYRPILGTSKHPQFLGQSGKQCWAEVWDVVGSLADRVLTTGLPSWSENLQLFIERYGYLEETYFTFSYSPIRDETGEVGGVLCAVSETTEQVIGERRLRTLRELTSKAAQAKTVVEGYNIIAQILAKNSADIPFALLYRVEAEGTQARLVGTAGIEAGTPVSPKHIDLMQQTDPWHLKQVNRTHQGLIVKDLTHRCAVLSGGAPSAFPSSAMVMPITPLGKAHLDGFLVLGISPRRAFDNEYQGFFDLVVSSITTALAKTDSYEAEPVPVGMFANVTNPKQAEAAWRQSEEHLKLANERFELAAAAVNCLIYDWDVEGGTVERTAGLTRILGYSLAEAEPTANWWLERVHPEDLQRIQQEAAVVLATRDRYTSEYRVRNKDNQYVHVTDCGIVAARDADGRPTRIVGSTVDITQRKQAEEALFRSEERLRLAQRAAKVGTWEWNLLTGEVSWSEGIWHLLGIEQGAETPSFTFWVDFIYTGDRQQAQRNIEAAIAESEYYYDEFRIQRRDGTIRWLASKGRVLRNGDGRAERLLGVNIDITERKRIEEERTQLLAREQQHTRRLQKLAFASIAINSTLSVNERLRLITDLARDIIEAHQSVTSMTIDENWSQAIHTVSLSDKYARWREYEAQPDGSGIYTLVCRMQRPIRMTQAELEAHPAWRRFGKEASNHPPMRGWLAAPFTDRNGKNMGLIQLSDKYVGEFTQEDEAILVQLAQMASAAIDIAQLYEESQRANRVKDEFLAILSHELRSPLNPILGWSTLLKTRKLDEAKTAEAIATIERNAKLQIQLIDDLLDVSRILQGKLTLNVAPVNLPIIIEAAIETMRTAAVAKSILIHTELSNVGRVSGDSGRLQQVVWNLLSNAIKFTPHGGRVEIWLEQVGNQAKLAVTDTGIGINPEFLPYVFDYFRQADASTTRKFGGLGLGLAIVRHLVELHGGVVSAASPGEGQGATFTVMLPLVSIQQDIKREAKPTDNEPDLTGARVLVVEDNIDSREFLVFVLEQYGATVMAAESASEAFEALLVFQPHVLVSDIGMPGEDGYAFLHKVRTLAAEQGGAIPAIALTAYAKNEDRDRALAVGFQRHLSKPVEPAELIAVVASLIKPKPNA
ncbi:hypothetical protein NUACC21_38920 [Scytonema sp. NUACC21]